MMIPSQTIDSSPNCCVGARWCAAGGPPEDERSGLLLCGVALLSPPCCNSVGEGGKGGGLWSLPGCHDGPYWARGPRCGGPLSSLFPAGYALDPTCWLFSPLNDYR